MLLFVVVNGSDLEIMNHWAMKSAAMMEIHNRLVNYCKLTMARSATRAELKTKGCVERKVGEKVKDWRMEKAEWEGFYHAYIFFAHLSGSKKWEIHSSSTRTNKKNKGYFTHPISACTHPPPPF